MTTESPRRASVLSEPPVMGSSLRSGQPASIVGLWLALGVLALMGIIVLHTFSPEAYAFYPRCGLFTLTGFHCPGCGSLRAVHHLSHGHWMAALNSNALLVVSLLGGVAWGAVRGLRRRSEPDSTLRISSRGVLMILLGVVGFGVLRNLPWFPFVLLAP